MSRTAFSVFIYGLYLITAGLVLIFAPNFLLSSLGFEMSIEIWPRVLGVFISSTGIYYVLSANNEQNFFFRATIFGRVFVFVTLTFMTFLFEFHFALALIGAVDLASAGWTFLTFKSDG